MTIPTRDENKASVRRFWEAMNKGQLDLLDELLAPDVVRHCQATPEINVRSREQFKDFLKQDAAVFPDSVQTLTHVVAEGDSVAVWATYEGTQNGQLGPFQPSGKKARFDFGAVFRMENGKIAEWWVTWDKYRSPEYEAAIPIRHAAAETGFFVTVEGLN